MNADLEPLKSEDSVIEDLKQMSQLIDLDHVPPPRCAADQDDSLDYRTQGIVNSLNEQQGRNVLMTYSGQRRRQRQGANPTRNNRSVKIYNHNSHSQLPAEDFREQSPPSPSHRHSGSHNLLNYRNPEQLEMKVVDQMPSSQNAASRNSLPPNYKITLGQL